MTQSPAADPFDPQVFKAVMRKVAGTVTVIATASDTGLHGMTATAMCSVSAVPPMVLIVVNRSARTHLHIDTKKAFTISILGEHQLDVADLFATKGDDPFAQVAHRLLADGCPVIAGAAAHVHCTVETQLDAGTHTIFVGRVLDAGTSAALPLVYQDARYGRLAGD